MSSGSGGSRGHGRKIFVVHSRPHVSQAERGGSRNAKVLGFAGAAVDGPAVEQDGGRGRRNVRGERELLRRVHVQQVRVQLRDVGPSGGRG
jgi:hypothetical protein